MIKNESRAIGKSKGIPAPNVIVMKRILRTLAYRK